MFLSALPAIAHRYTAHVRRRRRRHTSHTTTHQPHPQPQPQAMPNFSTNHHHTNNNNNNNNHNISQNGNKADNSVNPGLGSGVDRGDAVVHRPSVPPAPPPSVVVLQEASQPGIADTTPTAASTTVDAGTQYSRPATPSTPLVHPASASASDPPARQATGSLDALLAPSMPAPAPAVVGSKRNTPDAATTTAPAASEATVAALTSEPRTEPATAAACIAQSKAEKKNDDDDDDADDDGADGSPSKRRRPPKPAPRVLPRHYEDASPRDLVVLVSSMLMELIRFNDQIPLRDGSLTRFHSRSPPRISVPDYLQRIATHATLSPPILLSMVYYIDRLCALYPAFTISSLTVHRFLISSATVASKGLSDSFWTNKTYARVGGISVAELALLELEFLWRVEWRIVPQPEVLEDYYRSLVDRCDEYVLEDDNLETGDSGELQAGNGQNEPQPVVKDEPPNQT